MSGVCCYTQCCSCFSRYRKRVEEKIKEREQEIERKAQKKKDKEEKLKSEEMNGLVLIVQFRFINQNQVYK